MKKIKKVSYNKYFEGAWSDYSRYSIKRKKSKTDWSGIHFYDGFRYNIESAIRIHGQRAFYKEIDKAQAMAKSLAGSNSKQAVSVKPQLAPAYTDYPIIPATIACIGLTAYLTFKENLKEEVLSVFLNDYLENPLPSNNADLNQYKGIVRIIAKTVETRLILESLSREPALGCVEYYRLFCASQKSEIDSLTDIIEVAVLYGDILAFSSDSLHPITKLILDELLEVSQPFLNQLRIAEAYKYVEIGVEWVKALSTTVSKYIPPSDTKENYQAKTNDISDNRKFEALNKPHPPMLQRPNNILEQIANTIASQNPNVRNILSSLGEANSEAKEIVNIVRTLEQAVVGNSGKWQDMRSDLVEFELKLNPFDRSSIEGMPESGHEVTVSFNGKDCTEELFDRPIPVPSDLDAQKLREYNELQAKSEPVVNALRKTLYTNIRSNSITERYASSGALDSNRLAVGDFSDAIFKRYRIVQEVDQRGSPLLVIACDGSGSLEYDQMQMLKVLTYSWLDATSRTRIKLMAGIYHSEDTHRLGSSPLIQWIYHPLKTPAISRHEASIGLVLLPNSGTGIQRDALSLKFIFEEADKLARGNMVYMILITDTEWNKSFKDTKITSTEEVYNVLAQAYENFGDRLHITLVALGVSDQRIIDLVEEVVDYTIKVPSEQLRKYDLVANRISLYVAKCMKERNLLLQKCK